MSSANTEGQLREGAGDDGDSLDRETMTGSLSVSEHDPLVRAAPAVTRAAIIVVAAYIAAQMLADVSSVKIGIVLGLAVDMGTFVYPLTFTLRDAAHKLLGKASARTLIVTAAAINVVMALYLRWVASVPSDPEWGLGGEFSAILAPVGRIVVASIVAEVVSELLDTEVYHWFVTRVTTRHQWLRVVLSNGVSIPVDSLIFSVLAFAPIPALGGGLPWQVVGQIFVFNLGLKYAVTLLSVPIIYLVPDRDWAAEREGTTGS